MRLYANIYSVIILLVVLLSLVQAQGDDTTSKAATTKGGATNTNTNTNAATTSAATKTASATDASDTNESITSGSASASASASETDAVVTKLTSSASATGSYDGIHDAPTVTNGAAPTYVVTIPDTADAPYMQKSSLPQGTVFICVGAVLAFALVVTLLYRASVAYFLRRGMKRASANGYMHPMNDYSHGGGKSTALYSQGVGSTLSLDPLTGGGKGNTKGGFLPDSVKQSLFFSPTAGAGAHSAGNRGSGYLPAGYYAAGASVAGGGVAGNGRPISMADFTNMRPQSSGYQAARTNDSPRDSPLLRPTESPYGRLGTAGQSTTSLGVRSEGRAPSAYLDDLFDYAPVSQHGHDR